MKLNVKLRTALMVLRKFSAIMFMNIYIIYEGSLYGRAKFNFQIIVAKIYQSKSFVTDCKHPDINMITKFCN